MTPEIEKRIKAVQAGRVPAGYKKSKVGIVPKEWEELKLSHYLTVSKEKNKDLQFSKDDVFSISGELGIVNQIELLGRSYAGESVAPYGIVKPNDIVYTKSPLKANPYGIIKTNKTGKAGIVSTLYAIFNCKNNVNPNFVQYYFESDKNLNDYLHPIVNIGAKHDMKISDENSLSGVVVFPPLSEQKKIAEILATQDRVIELKEKMIAEKQSQKKYLMQTYLMKKKHSPLFQKKWKRIYLSEILKERRECNELENLRICSVAVNNGVVDQKEHLGKSMAAENTSNYAVVHYGDIVYTKSPTGAFPYGIIKQSQLKEDVAVSPLYGVYEPYCYEIGYLLQVYFSYANNANNYLKPIVNKGAKNTILISNQTFLKPSLYLPIDIEEIKYLYKIFKSADEEISLLQKDLEQEKLKKKSLMQLLLTGLVRVNE